MTATNHQNLTAIVGPTGVGKTAYALSIASKIQAEIISADSRQVFKGMDIATGKDVKLGQWQQVNNRPTLVINEIPVHGLDLTAPDQPFSVAEWLSRINPIIAEIIKRGHQPLLVGGTGFYLDALAGKVSTINLPLNDTLRQELGQESISQLQERLTILNPSRFQAMNHSDQLNPARLIRAIEIASYQGTPPDKAADAQISPHAYSLRLVGLTMPQGDLYAKADARIDTMVSDGLVDETRLLLQQYPPHNQAFSGIGYREMAQYLANELSLNQAIKQIKFRTHDYIRRQNTWWKKQPVTWVDVSQPNWRMEADQLIESLQ